MSAQSGKDMLLKLDQTGSGSFLTVAGLRTRSLALNAATIDVTDAESAGRWRELLDGGGIRKAALAGKGIFKDQSSDAQIRACSLPAPSATGSWSCPISASSKGRSRSSASNSRPTMPAR